MTAPDDRTATPRQQRLHRLIRGELSCAQGERREIVVRNISSSGLGASSKGVPVVRGEQVMITLPRLGNVSGIVRWSKGAAFGVELEGTVDLEILAEALKSLRGVAAPAAEWEVKRMHRIETPRVDPARLRRV